jgi:hypothetical protein
MERTAPVMKVASSEHSHTAARAGDDGDFALQDAAARLRGHYLPNRRLSKVALAE